MNLNLISYCSSQLCSNFSLRCITNRRVGALLTTNPPFNNKLALIWRCCAWKYEQLRRHCFMFVHGRHTHSQYRSLASTKASYLKFWNETKFHFLLTRHFIDTLDQALSLPLSIMSYGRPTSVLSHIPGLFSHDH